MLRTDVLLVAVCSTLLAAVQAAIVCTRGGTGVTVCDPRWPIPSNPALVELAAAHGIVICAEDNVAVAGAGLCHAIAKAGLLRPFRALGLPRHFLAHDTRRDILREHRLNAAGIAGAITDTLEGSAA
ncbi:MAG TPA: transketolase C-terminal domain-containing protein [Solirubrobacteraceae bacterium]|jgi:1-deoxy-D-xylulose-5-phosphate synthase